jgi:translation initiation factor IF-1
MADTRSLSVIGLMLGAATMMVMLVGTVVVTDHVSGRLNMDGMSAISQPATAR